MPRGASRRPFGGLVFLVVLGALGGWLHRPAGAAASPRKEVPSGVAASFRGRVVGVSDGDTVKVLSGGAEHRIRLIGIDAPEKAQAFGKVSRQALADRIFGKEVEVRARGRDSYGRVLGKLLDGSGDVNLGQIQAGLAWHYAHFADSQFPGDAPAYAEAERQARAGGLGLWSEPAPVPPWRWRRERRSQGREG